MPVPSSEMSAWGARKPTAEGLVFVTSPLRDNLGDPENPKISIWGPVLCMVEMEDW